jgi:hypothetical protein
MITAVVLAAFSLLSGLGWGWMRNLGTPGTVTSWLAPASGVGIFVTHIAHAVGWMLPGHGVLSVTRVLGMFAAIGAGLWLLAHSDRLGILRAMGYTCLLVTVLGPVVQPWYLSWGLVLLAPI